MKGDGHNEEVVGEEGPVVHPVLHAEQSEGECEVERGLEVVIGVVGVGAGPEEDAIEDDDEDLEDEDV